MIRLARAPFLLCFLAALLAIAVACETTKPSNSQPELAPSPDVTAISVNPTLVSSSNNAILNGPFSPTMPVSVTGPSTAPASTLSISVASPSAGPTTTAPRPDSSPRPVSPTAIIASASPTIPTAPLTVAPPGPPIPGNLWAWGENRFGKLGDGTTVNHTTPFQVSGLGEVIDVGGGAFHSVVLKANGTVWTWGDFNLVEYRSRTPLQIPGLINITAIASDTYHGLALKSDGSVWAWGENWTGMLGDGTYQRKAPPVRVSNLSGVLAIDAGIAFSLALKADGTVWAWGENDRGQLGIDILPMSNLPVQVPGLTGIVSIAAGGYHSLALKSDGTVWSWGWNQYGQLGSAAGGYSPKPVKVSSISDVVAIAAGSYNSLALKVDGTVWTLGAQAVKVPFVSGAKALAASEYHNLILKTDGTVWGWGSNDKGQLGGVSSSSTPLVQATGLTGVVSLVTALSSSYAIQGTGSPPIQITQPPQDVAPVASVPPPQPSPTASHLPLPAGAKRIAYIYLTNTGYRDQFQLLMETKGYWVDPVLVTDIARTDFNQYSLIVIGPDSGSGYTWGTEALLKVIHDSWKPVLGIQFGGQAFFNKLKLSLASMGGTWTATESGIHVFNTTSPIFNRPNPLSIPLNGQIETGYSHSTPALYVKDVPPAGVELLASQAKDLQHYPLTKEGSNIFWGFETLPSSLTPAGKNLLANIVAYLAGPAQ